MKIRCTTDPRDADWLQLRGEFFPEDFPGEHQQFLESLWATGRFTAFVASAESGPLLDFNQPFDAVQQIQRDKIAIVFNMCERINHTGLLEPHAAALLDILQVPYTGSNPFTLGLCLDKIRVKKLLAYHHIPTPR